MKVTIDKQKMICFEEAYCRYEEIRRRLPQAVPPAKPVYASGLLEIADSYDGFLFDSFGVLNIGETAIEGAAEVLQYLRRLEKPFCVLTNAASYTRDDAYEKYQKLGLDVRHDEIISSRDVLFNSLVAGSEVHTWSAIAAQEDEFADTNLCINHLIDDVLDWNDAEGILFLSGARWSNEDQERLIASLKSKPRQILVGNPDLVAPREKGLTVEPGYWAHDIQDRTGAAVLYFGKPFGLAFEMASDRIGKPKLAMIGDTLHTDILGGQAAGIDTILITDHGLFKDKPIQSYLDDTGIHPTWIMSSI